MPLPEGVEQTELDGGVTVVTESVPSVRSVALGLWVRTGSRDETPTQAGVSHFLEHLLFKGTKRYSAIEISEYFDGLGAAINAATSKETTHLYSRFLDEHTEAALRPARRDVPRADLPGHRLRAPGRHRGDRDVRGRALRPGPRRPRRRDLRRAPARPPRSRHRRGDRLDPGPRHRRLSPGALPRLEPRRRRRRAPRARADRRAGQGPLRCADRRGRARQRRRSAAAARLCFYPKETEQYHICFGAPGITRGDDRRFALGVLDTVFGGSTSSRLFREVREKRGLAYAVGSYTEQYRRHRQRSRSTSARARTTSRRPAR